MKNLITTLLMIACLGVSMQSYGQTCSDVPVINSFEPNTGFIGSVVTIFGANFDSQDLANNQVYFGATEAEVISATFGKLEVIVPVGASTAPISVKNQCDLTAYSKVAFNGIFCPTPIDNQTYQNTAFELGGIYGAYNMISQDMDLDGKPDVVSSGLNGGITIAKNNSTPGNLNFSAYNFPTATRSVFAADFDGDGLKDLVTNASVLRNTSTGPGNFGLAYAHSSQGISGYQVAAGDFNNDGKVDIVGENGNVAWIAFNTSTGPGNFSFTTRQVIGVVGSRCTGIQVADVDGDGRTDFIASQGGANRAVSVRNTTAPGSFTASFEAPEFWSSDSDWSDGRGTFPYRAQIADFDKDGKIDFTSCNYLGSTNVAIWRNISTVGDIVFAPTVNIPSPTRNYRIGVGDVDGDGFPDVVTKSLGINVFSVYKNTSGGPGSPTFAARVDYTSSSRAEVSGIVIGDLDGDFVPDIATSGIGSRTIRFHRNTSAQVDTDPPTTVTKNITVALSPDGTVTITPQDVDNGSSDACGLDRLELNIMDFTCDDIGENEVILTAYDNAGNSTSAPAVVNVQPAAIIVTGQTTVCQGETITMNANDGDSYQWFNNGMAITGATNQQYVATVTGSYTVAVTNAGGCSGTSLPTDVTVNDNPTVDIFPSGTTYICPPGGTAVLTASQSSIYQWMKDGVDIPNATQQIYTATSVGNYSVRVIDLFGCSAESDEVTVAANPPEIDITEGATAISTGSLSDYGDVFPNVDNVKSFTINNTGTNALDIAQILINGTDSQYFSIVDAPGSIAANSSATFDLVFNAPDITSYSASVTIISNDCDEANITFNVTAEITCVAASVTTPADLFVNTDQGLCGAIVNYSVAVDGLPRPEVSYSFSGATSGNGQGTGDGSLFNVGITVVTISVNNPCGSDTKSFSINVADKEEPNVITQDLIINLDAAGNASITPEQINNGSSDACGIDIMTLDISTFNCNDVGNLNTVTLTVTDVNGNTQTGTATVSVNDITNPTVAVQNAIVVLDANGQASITTDDINNGSNDACGIESIELSQTDFDCTDVGTNVVTLTVTDVNGNVSSSNATVTVEDNILPELMVPDDITVLNDAGVCGAVVNIGKALGADNCGVADIVDNGLAFYPVGTTTVTWTATDVNGNETTATQSITVLNDLPVINGFDMPESIEINKQGFYSATYNDNNVESATWDWGDGNVSTGQIVGQTVNGSHTYSNTGLYTVTLTIEDACGEIDTQAHTFVPVYDPGAGHITGGGHFTSQSGDISSDASAQGKSNYGFQGKYLKNGRLQGNMSFHVNKAGFKFKSGDTQWLVVLDDNAIMKGTGALNGVSGYEYTATMVDVHVNGRAGNDRFRIQIRETATGSVVYDNESGVALDQETGEQIDKGAIVIHRGVVSTKGKKKTVERTITKVDGAKEDGFGDLSKGEILLKSFPNPSTGLVTIRFATEFGGKAKVAVMNPRGNQMAELYDGSLESNKILELIYDTKSLPSGVYIVRLMTMGEMRSVKLVVEK